MPDVHITYEETLKYLMNEWLETRDFSLRSDMMKWQQHIKYIDERLQKNLTILNSLLNQDTKDVVEIEKAILKIHTQLCKLYEIRIDNMEGN